MTRIARWSRSRKDALQEGFGSRKVAALNEDVGQADAATQDVLSIAEALCPPAKLEIRGFAFAQVSGDPQAPAMLPHRSEKEIVIDPIPQSVDYRLAYVSREFPSRTKVQLACILEQLARDHNLCLRVPQPDRCNHLAEKFPEGFRRNPHGLRNGVQVFEIDSAPTSCGTAPRIYQVKDVQTRSRRAPHIARRLCHLERSVEWEMSKARAELRDRRHEERKR